MYNGALCIVGCTTYSSKCFFVGFWSSLTHYQKPTELPTLYMTFIYYIPADSTKSTVKFEKFVNSPFNVANNINL